MRAWRLLTLSPREDDDAREDYGRSKDEHRKIERLEG